MGMGEADQSGAPAGGTGMSNEYIIARPPEPGEWECIVLGNEPRNMVIFCPAKGTEPNAFHRLMHWLAFGFRWRRRQ